MQVDGIGSYQVYTQSRLTVGPISSSARPMLGLLTDPSLPAVTIERGDEDYFLQAEKPIRIDDHEVTRQLLSDGQRVCLSDKCRMKFNLPNAASTTATLSFSGGRLPRNDINYVILMDDCLLIGPSGNCHVRATQLQAALTLVKSPAGLICRTDKPLLVEGQVVSSSTPLPLKKSIKIGDLSLVVTPL
ncbi:hypothetical protein ACFL6U_17665 [Planctomycetota bacterium]